MDHGLSLAPLASTSYFSASPHLTADNFAENNAASDLVEGLAKAHEVYGVRGTRILFIVQPNERNVFDQRLTQQARHEIHVVSQTLPSLAVLASLDNSTHTLTIAIPSATNPSPYEISTIHFRASSLRLSITLLLRHAFSPRARPRNQVPLFSLQLAGGKKVQETLMGSGVLERFLSTKAQNRALDLTVHAADVKAT
ncbi:hypothetical protein BDR07DRAFT_1496312 [Suillus spraguei]|nr:hypothetical protein BDR07DRAFT_1496312 [Suillus spraguei]